jgi:FtsP/CotA-like multicopper oxidase with cupredoxin domain/membrane protein insertase Oxa1/YidC/SpoIIIJ
MAPTYSIFPSLQTISEGQALQTMFHVTGVASGTVLYWAIGGTNISASDFSAGALTGQISIVTNASGVGMVSISHTLANDLTTEGLETLQIKLFSNAARTVQVGPTASVAINDSSRNPTSPPTYTISPSVAAINEGLTLTTTVGTSNVPPGRVLYWALSGTGITAADFSIGALSGSGTVGANGQFTFSHTLANDLLSEGAESLQIRLFSDAARTEQLGSTTVVTLNDTSLTPPPTYAITPSAAAINEGLALTTTVATTNVAAGTVLYWALSGTGITAADFSSGALSGSGTVGANGQFSFAHTLANDLLTEGVEGLQIRLFSNAARTLQVGATAAVSLNDTSRAPVATYTITPSLAAINEGLALTTSVATANVAAGTVLYWSLSGTGITAADFSSGALSGSGTVGATGRFSFAHTLANDLLTEGPEALQIKLFSDAARTLQVGATAAVTVNDTSRPAAPPSPTYMIIPSASAINEGLVLTTTVVTAQVAAGTVLYWSLSGTGITAADFSSGALSGSAAVASNGRFSFSHTLANDLLSEGPEALQIKLFSNAARTVQVGATTAVTLNDTSRAPAPAVVPTYTITPSATALNEGLALTTTVATTNVAAGTVLYWALSGTGITAADFSSGALTGSATVGANGQFSFPHTLANDLLSEGSEALQIRLFSNAARTVQVGATAAVTVNDTSLTPPPTYTITPSTAAINEGLALTTTVATTNVAAGTVLYWALSGTGITAADFSSGALTGSGTVGVNGQFSFSHTLANDLLSEGPESLQIRLFSNAARTVQVGATAAVTINDTSLTPVPTYTISPSATAINEGQVLITTVQTTNLPAGTSLYWSLSGIGITSADFSSGTLTGIATVGVNGQFVLNHTLANDLSTEGNESLQIKLFSDPALSTVLGSSNVSILDTSKAPALPTYALSPSAVIVNEGDALITTITTTNVPNGTILFYQIRGLNVEPTDFSVGSITGQVLINGGRAVFTHVLNRDLKTEGDEVLLMRLFSDRPGGTPIGSQVQVTVKDTSVALPVATEIYQPLNTPFAVKKWASPVPVPTLKRPDYVGTQPDIWGTNFAPQTSPGGQPGLYQNLDPTQALYGGIAPEFYNQTVAGTSTPYFTTGELTSWYSQREGARYQVVVDGANQVYSTEIYGYDSTFPGSTFKTKVGQPVVVRHWNDLPTYPGMPALLPQRESVHLHGGHNPAHTDGYPSYVINPGMYRDYYYANTVPMGNNGLPDMSESPSTMWYHDHGEDITDLNVIKGMAGFWLSFDSRELDLIKNHILPGWWKSSAQWNEQEFMEFNSPYDIPLALTDRQFNADGSFFYDGFPIGNQNDGYLGDVMMVNGKSYPYLYVEPTQYRLRMLGASTARIWQLSIQDEAGVKQSHLRIGNDTWLMPNPIAMTEFTLSPAQRADTVMDFSGYAPGTVLYLVNTAEQNKGTGPAGDLYSLGTTGFSERIMKIVVGTPTPITPTNSLNTTTLLREHTPILASEISNHRTFEFGRSNGMWLINQTHFDSSVSYNPMPLGVAEQWTLVNGSGGWWHPIHIHLESHQLQSIDGRAPSADFFPEKQFKSDTTLLGPNTTAVINMKFRTFTGPFVFHCHILQHEDSMMMFNFDPNLDGAAYLAGDPIPSDRDYSVYPYYHAHDGVTLTGPHGTPALAASQPQAVAGTAPADVSPLILAAFKFSAWGTSEADVMRSSTQDSYLNGRDGSDNLQGDLGNDMLVGGAGNDVITGGAGDDLIAGELGNDTLSGGAGRDGFYYVSADASSIDVITDFQAGTDFISLHHALVNTNGSGTGSWSYIGSDLFTGMAGQVRFFNGMLQADLDGNALSDINARLVGISTFDQAWLNVPTVVTNAANLI